jgi:hypothetical protein
VDGVDGGDAAGLISTIEPARWNAATTPRSGERTITPVSPL